MKKQQRQQNNQQQQSDKPATLKDLLGADVLSKLKQQQDQLKADEDKRKEDERIRVEEARKAEQKRLDNDFEYLLNNSKLDWKKHK
ncbi:YqkE family protein [Paenibacillus sp. PR3]|uniref:YqkE family protein n=1 Tax=Paenibacillus terricola TaxID=2763503 RepID=A0ABR8MSI7_9BACL|nr:YqkE family protein [Paenibacillus terricola]MBD3917504.1 YqkE family protein [Paenibacillus terricola]